MPRVGERVCDDLGGRTKPTKPCRCGAKQKHGEHGVVRVSECECAATLVCFHSVRCYDVMLQLTVLKCHVANVCYNSAARAALLTALLLH